METGEVIDEKVYASPRPPPKISFKDIWMKELVSKVAGGSGEFQQIQPKSKTQLSRTERPVSKQPPGLLTQEIEKCLVWLRKHKLKNGETCECTIIQPELCASVC